MNFTTTILQYLSQHAMTASVAAAIVVVIAIAGWTVWFIDSRHHKQHTTKKVGSRSGIEAKRQALERIRLAQSYTAVQGVVLTPQTTPAASLTPSLCLTPPEEIQATATCVDKLHGLICSVCRGYYDELYSTAVGDLCEHCYRRHCHHQALGPTPTPTASPTPTPTPWMTPPKKITFAAAMQKLQTRPG